MSFKHLTVPLLASLVLPLGGCGGGMEPESIAYRRIDHQTHTSHIRGPGGAKWSEALKFSKSYSVRGIDVSKFQGDIDWQAVQSDGVKFAWIKATEGGNRVDDKFSQNWSQSKAMHIAHGAYHFVYWCRDPLEQIKWFEAHVPREASALPPVLDVELTPTSPTCRRILHREPTLQEIRIMLEELEHHYGKKPIIYTTVDFYKGILADNAFNTYPIWVRSTKDRPEVPYGKRKWHFWQFQSDGKIAGIKGKVDVNAFQGDSKQWQAFLEPKRIQNPNVAPQDVVPEEFASTIPDQPSH